MDIPKYKVGDKVVWNHFNNDALAIILITKITLYKYYYRYIDGGVESHCIISLMEKHSMLLCKSLQVIYG